MRLRSPFALGAIMAVVLGLGGGAWAYFTAHGSGSGTASVGTVSNIEVVGASGTVANKLFPGASGDLKVQFNNPNAYAVTIVTLAPGSGPSTGSSGIGTCTTTGVSVNPQSNLSITVAAGSGVVVTIPNGAIMDATSESGCQNATFQVPISITVHK